MESSFGIGTLKDALQGAFTLGEQRKANEAGAVPSEHEQASATKDKEKDLGPMGAYVVELSDAAKKLAAEGNPFTARLEAVSGGGGGSSANEGKDPIQRQMDDLKKQIEIIEKEIEKLQSQNMDEEQKRQLIAVKRAELSQYQAQLAQLQQEQQKAMQQSLKASGASGGGGAFYNTGSLT